MPIFSSVKSGLWSDPATWGEVSDYPQSDGDSATINVGHIVTLDVATDKTITILMSGGNLRNGSHTIKTGLVLTYPLVGWLLEM